MQRIYPHYSNAHTQVFLSGNPKGGLFALELVDFFRTKYTISAIFF